MKVTFELTENDLKYFRGVMREVREKHMGSSEAKIIKVARNLLDTMEETSVPDFVADRMEKLKILIGMLEDEEWALKGRDRERVVRGLAYFAEPDDIIPDKVPVLGFLDDAIMVELVVNELVHEIDAYMDFCKFRNIREERLGPGEDLATRDEWLDARRRALHDRMRRRRTRRRKRNASGGPRSLITLW